MLSFYTKPNATSVFRFLSTVPSHETSRATLPFLGLVFHYLLIALELCRDDLVPGEFDLVVDVDRMLLLVGFVQLQARLHENLQRKKGERKPDF